MLGPGRENPGVWGKTQSSQRHFHLSTGTGTTITTRYIHTVGKVGNGGPAYRPAALLEEGWWRCVNMDACMSKNPDSREPSSQVM